MIIKCKMCGFDIEVKKGQSVCECEFCGSKQTIPTLVSNKKIDSFNRANLLRIRCEYDKAIEEYESLIEMFPNDPEAYWGKCLAKYGIEYVDDPKTNEKIPTCHRTRYESILEDKDYLKILETSSKESKEFYIKEATEIDRLQKEILKISNKEEPYDIFICYKETDKNGNRTIDSVIAQEIYEKLIKNDYKVFFAKITLESKLGLEYEPIIFAALKSAKVMLAVGTSVDNFNAVWVKNEWSRFLGFMKEDTNKYLIPCYKNMDAYDMPIEFISFQSQDVSKVGYMQDLLRGINKIFNKDTLENDLNLGKKENKITLNDKINKLFMRCDILLANKDFSKASEIVDEILNNDPENARAYIYQLLIQLKLVDEKQLAELKVSIKEYRLFNVAYKFADGKYKKKLDSYIIKTDSNVNLYEKDKKYKQANLIYEKRGFSHNAKAIKKALKLFNELGDYASAFDKKLECEKLLYELKNKKHTSLAFKIVISILVIIIIAIGLTRFLGKEYFNSYSLYKDALNYIELGDYTKAEEILTDLNFKDSKEQLAISQSYKLFESGDYESGIEKIYEIGGVVNVNYDGNGGIASSPNTIIKKSRFINDIATRDGYNFYGWTVSSYSIDNTKGNYSAIVNLKASWEEIKYNIVYNLNGSLVSNLIYSYGIEDSFVLPNPSKKGYTFIGWTEDNSSFEPTINLKIEKGTIGDKFYKANFKNSKYLITYYSNGGTEFSQQEVYYDMPYSLKIPTKTGYDFKGWYEDENLIENEGIWKYLEDKTIVAHWSIQSNEYAINYILNDGVNNKDNPLTYTSNSSNLSIYNPTKKGYTFLGWSVNDSSYFYKDYVIDTKLSKDIKLEAKWEANTYIMSLYQDAESERPLVSLPAIYDSNIKLPKPSQSNMTFLGWYYKNDRLPQEFKYTYDCDIKLVAKWESIKVDYSYRDIDGSSVEIYKLPIKEAVIIPSIIGDKKVVKLCDNLVDNNNILKYVYIPKSIKEISVNAFDNCLPEIVFYEGSETEWRTVKKTNDVEFFWSKILLKLNTKVDKMECINKDNKWTYLCINNDITNLYSLKCLDLSMTNVDLNKEFTNCNIISIGRRAFNNSKLEYIELPKTLKHIQHNAFVGCKNLSKINLPEGLLSIGAYSFLKCFSLTNIYIPSSVNYISKNPFQECVKLNRIEVSINNKFYDSRENCNAIIKTSNDCLVSSSISTFIPNTISILGTHCFMCSPINKIVIPNSVQIIESAAFGLCSNLTSIEIPNSVKSINKSAFFQCKLLTDVIIFANIEYIDESLFMGCSNLNTIAIHHSVKRVKSRAFEGCNNLQSIFYDGTTGQWKSIVIEDNNECFSSALLVYVK